MSLLSFPKYLKQQGIQYAFFCWLMMATMPIVNAHSGVNGVWESLCTYHGIQLVKIQGDEKPVSSGGNHCLFSQVLNNYENGLHFVEPVIIAKSNVSFNTQSVDSSDFRFLPPPRAPPLIS